MGRLALQLAPHLVPPGVRTRDMASPDTCLFQAPTDVTSPPTHAQQAPLPPLRAAPRPGARARPGTCPASRLEGPTLQNSVGGTS